MKIMPSNCSQVSTNNQSLTSFGALKFKNRNPLNEVKNALRRMNEKERSQYLRKLCSIDARTEKDGTDFIVDFLMDSSSSSGNLVGDVVDAKGEFSKKYATTSHGYLHSPTVSVASQRIRKARMKITGKEEPRARVTKKDISTRMAKGLKGFEVLG